MIETKSSTGKFKRQDIVYEAAQLREFPSGWVIEYYFADPETGVRTRYKIKKEKERKKIGDDRKARVVFDKECKSINKMLAGGWTPRGNLIQAKNKDGYILKW